MQVECKNPIVHIDYFFVTAAGVKSREELEYSNDASGRGEMEQHRSEGKILKCILLKCGYSKAVFAHVIPCKGVDEQKYVIGLIVQAVQWLGHVRLVLKGDNERSLQAAIKEAMARIRVEVKDIEQVMEERPPVHDSQAHGSAENGVRDVRGMLRTLRLDLESRIERQVPVVHPLMHWLVELSATIITAMKVMDDGLTPWARTRGRPFPMRGFCFGEKVMYKLPSKGPKANPDGSAGSRWREALFMGYSRSSNTYVVATDDGMAYPRSLERVPEPDRWQREALASLKATPENTKVKKDESIVFDQEAPKVEIPERIRHPLPRKMRVDQADLNRFGYTVGCEQCRHIQQHGQYKNGLTHDPRCTARIMDELGKTVDGQARLRKYEDRVTEALAKRLEEDVRDPPPAEPMAQQPGAVATSQPISSRPTRTLGNEAMNEDVPDEDDDMPLPAQPYIPRVRDSGHELRGGDARLEEAAGDDAAPTEGFSMATQASPAPAADDMNVDFVQLTDDKILHLCMACGWQGVPSIPGHCKEPKCHISGCLAPVRSRERWCAPPEDGSLAETSPGFLLAPVARQRDYQEKAPKRIMTRRCAL